MEKPLSDHCQMKQRYKRFSFGAVELQVFHLLSDLTKRIGSVFGNSSFSLPPSGSAELTAEGPCLSALVPLLFWKDEAYRGARAMPVAIGPETGRASSPVELRWGFVVFQL